MVFSNLPHQEKDAFFSLLDEYFQSRPELVSHLQGSSGSSEVKQTAGRVAAAASAFANSTPLSRNTPPAGLRSTQTFGDIDTSSKGKIVTSGLFNKTLQKTPSSGGAPQIPSAFAQAKNQFAPPPGRAHEVKKEEPEEQAQGEWAEALYDYDSTERGDLPIRANERVLVTERTTDDWWTGTFEGKSGLFPASYVKLL